MLAKDAARGAFIRVKKITPEMLTAADYYKGYLAPEGTVGMLTDTNSLLKEEGYGTMSGAENPGKTLLPLLSEVEEVSKEDLPPHVRLQEFPLGRWKSNMGSDPEVFILDEKGVVIPAWKFLPSKKDAVGYAEEKAYWDGFQAEFNTYPRLCHEEFTGDFFRGLQKVLGAAQKLFPGARLSHSSVVEVPFEMMQECTDEQAGLGCSPSFNAYTEESPLLNLEPRTLPIRFAGCHLHFEVKSGNMRTIIQSIDAIAGVMMVALLQGLEDPRRRKFYGIAGEFRTPSHGLEWRVPSSTLMCHPVALNLVMDVARVGRDVGRAGVLEKVWQSSPEEVQHIINNYDVEGALKVLDRNKDTWGEILRRNYEGKKVSAKVDALVRSGVRNMLDVSSMEKAWQIIPPKVGELPPPYYVRQLVGQFGGML